MTPRSQLVLFPNYGFEEELTGRRQTLSRGVRQQSTDLACAMALLSWGRSEDSDAGPVPTLLLTSAQPEELPECLGHVRCVEPAAAHSLVAASDSFVPWGWSRPAFELAVRLGLLPPAAPSLDCVRIVNSRRFQAEFDCPTPENLQCGSVICATLKEVQQAIALVTEHRIRGWVIKSELSHAGREQLRGHGLPLTEAQEAWLRRRFAAELLVSVEPRLEPIAEWGMQFTVHAQSGRTTNRDSSFAVTLDGITRLLSDSTGRYIGSVCGLWNDPDDQLVHCLQTGLQVAHAAASRGYRGPFGIDCMRYCNPDGSSGLRAVQDINARNTMGRLALAVRAVRPSASCCAWLCLPAAKCEQLVISLRNLKLPGVELVRTSPLRVCGRAVETVTLAVFADHPSDLCRISGVIPDIRFELPPGR